jgi:stringent starvation protein B
VHVPKAHVKEGRIVLNISPNATQSLQIDGEAVSFNARFGGVAQVIHLPIEAVLKIYARETGKGVEFSAYGDAGAGEDRPGATPTVAPSLPPAGGSPGDSPRGGKSGRPSLKVVK